MLPARAGRRSPQPGGSSPGSGEGLLRFWLVFLVAAFLSLPVRSAESHPHARLKISGYGILGDLRLKQQIRLLELQKRKPEFFGADVIEDSSIILFSRLCDEGFLQPEITVLLNLEDGRKVSYVWRDANQEPLPRPTRARRVEFKIRKGVLYHYADVAFTGLSALSQKRARGFFYETSGLIRLKRNRVYSPERLKRSVANLSEVLQRMGFQNADVQADDLKRNDRTGDVTVQIRVVEGARFMVNSVRREVFFGTASAPGETRTNFFHRPYSKFWEQDFAQSAKTNYFRQGYPETSVELRTVRRQVSGPWILLDLEAEIKTGPRIRVGEVIFEGNMRTREGLVEARVPLREGNWLDPMKAEQGRYRLSRLGVFDLVELRYKPTETNIWDVTYHLKEGKQIDVHLLFGFGSYDLLRSGVEVNQYNFWGLAHNTRLRLVQSFKSSSGDYTYTIPELLGEDADLFFNASALRREEISFTRTEYGGGTGVRKLFRNIDTDTTVRYNYGILEASETSDNFAALGALNPTVGELIADIRHDRRDNPLYPHKGYQILGHFEVANRVLGGDVNYERIEVAASYHLPIDDSAWLHLGLKHGILASINGTVQDLPFTRRFFPGGENSVRGYREGGASSRNEQGKIVGSETYTGGSVEWEQALTPHWSLVGFVDGVEFAQSLKDYPGTEALFSAGGGVRWRTVVGPVRLEYGHNLNPRPGDPSGTLQFSLGFPF